MRDGWNIKKRCCKPFIALLCCRKLNSTMSSNDSLRAVGLNGSIFVEEQKPMGIFVINMFSPSLNEKKE